MNAESAKIRHVAAGIQFGSLFMATTWIHPEKLLNDSFGS
jgi:hypothetical protein